MAVVDLGSNSFRLVVFAFVPRAWWRRTDELYDVVRIGAGLGEQGRLGDEPVSRALDTLAAYAHFASATGLRRGDVVAVGTSAIRDAENRDEFVRAAERVTGWRVRVLPPKGEARYGYLAAVNSTTLADGVTLDLGGGSLQLVHVRGRRAEALESWPLGAVRMSERFLPDPEPTKKQIKALRSHVARQLADAAWLAQAGDRVVGIGGTVRNLAAALVAEQELPYPTVQGFAIERAALGELIDRLAAMPAAKRGQVPGIKSGRGDVILAGALVVEGVLEAGGFDAIEATEAGLREGVFFEQHLAPADPPLVSSVREATVRNLALHYEANLTHAEHVRRLALQMFDSLAKAGLHEGDAAERELLGAAALLHDIGVAIDYDDHHKHSRYLILNAGLPGYTPRETALIAQMARYHRKGSPTIGIYAPLTRDGDSELLARCAALLRVAEQLERSRDQLVRDAIIEPVDGHVELRLDAESDAQIARWAAARQSDVFEQAFGRQLVVVGPPPP